MKFTGTFDLDALCTPEAMHRTLDNREDAARIGAAYKTRLYRMQHEGAEWFGAGSVEELAGVVARGTAEGTARVEQARRECAALTLPAARTIKPVWSERHLIGTRMDVNAMLAGQPRAWGRFERTRVAHGNRTAVLYIPLGANAGTSASDLGWQPVAGVVVADLLEAAGYRCEIWADAASYGGGSTVTARTLIKRAESPIDLNAIARVTHPAIFRGVFVGWQANVAARNGVRLGAGYGSSQTPSAADFGDENAIQIRRAIGLPATVAEIKRVIAQFGGES